MCLENEDVLVASISVKEYLPLCPVLSLAAPQWWQIPGMGSHSGLAVRSGSEMEKTGKAVKLLLLLAMPLFCTGCHQPWG